MALQQTLRSIETEITNLIKAEIQKKGLVKTGKLLNSISTVVMMKTDGSLSIKVSGEDYYDELDDKYNITRDAFASSGFKVVEDLIGTAYVEYIEGEIDKKK
jgi:hypothetical protein